MRRTRASSSSSQYSVRVISPSRSSERTEWVSTFADTPRLGTRSSENRRGRGGLLHRRCPGSCRRAYPDRTGKYRPTPAEATSRISYADFAIALLDEVDAPKHHRTLLGLETG
jgi:hypothetical protein